MSIFSKSKSKKTEKQISEDAKKIGADAISENRSNNLRGSAALLKRSWMTEKAGSMTGDRKYIFIVSNNANKSEVKKEIESSYGVKVNDVNMVVRKGKAKRLGQSVGRTPDFKKAIITLKHGYKIEGLTA